MKIKRYVAPDMRRAMRQVRENQGPDAVILSSRRIEDGIEVITAIDYDSSLFEKQPDETQPANRQVGKRCETIDEISFDRAVESWSREPTLIGMKEEVASLRKLLESQLASLAWNEDTDRHPGRTAVARELIALGLTPTLARELAKDVDETSGDVESVALHLLQQRVPVLAGEVLDESSAIALVGPTGVGKTTTIAKLAARFVLKHGADALGLITTDGFRIGAQEQLLTYGRILGVPVKLVRDGTQLADTLESMRDKKLILIDSAGMSQRDRLIHRELAAIRDNGAAIRVLLALPSNAQRAVLDETVQSFRALDPVGCVLTKVDETACLGGAMSVLIARNLPLAYVTDGQNVPEDIHRAGGKRFDLIERARDLRRTPVSDYIEVAANA